MIEEPFEGARFVNAMVGRGRLPPQPTPWSLLQRNETQRIWQKLIILLNLYIYFIVANAVRSGVVSSLIKAEIVPRVSCA